MQVQANVPTNANFEEIASKALVNLKLMMGDEQGNLNLENNVTRCEFVTLVNRMMTYDVDDSSLSVPFKDISQNIGRITI